MNKKILFLLLFLTPAVFPQLGDFLFKTSGNELFLQIYGETVSPFAPFDAANSIQKVKKVTKPVVTDKKLTVNSTSVDFKIFKSSVKGLVSFTIYYSGKKENYLMHLKFENEKSFKNLQKFVETLFEEMTIKNGAAGLNFRRGRFSYDLTGDGKKPQGDVSILIDSRPGKNEAFIGNLADPAAYQSCVDFNYPKFEVDPYAMTEQKKFEFYNNMASELYEVVVLAQEYYKKPKAENGGGNSFVGFVIPDNMKETQNSVFGIDAVSISEIILSATTKLDIIGQDGKTPLKIRFVTRPDDMQPEVVN
ncbi:hypothetical protein MASR2M39_01360 [Ignavibacteriales bacterium]